MAKIKLYVDVLPSEPVPAGTYLVHDHVRPVAPLGLNSFRAWIQTKAGNLVPCHCNFGGCKNSQLHKLHYRLDMGQHSRLARCLPPCSRCTGLPNGR